MPIRIAIVGPGRVGMALGRRWHLAGAELIGFVGRSPEATARAVQFCGAGRPLQVTDLSVPHVVVFAVGDPDLPAAVQACAAVPPRSCALWLHTSGRHDLTAFAAVAAAGARVGALHPAAPFPDAETGLRRLVGAPAVLQGDAAAVPLLKRLCELLGMRPLVARTGDRTLYHAACALAANGLSALFDLAESVLDAHGGLPEGSGRDVVAALMGAVLEECAQRGGRAALSGPVVRGDAETVASHGTALGRSAPEALAAYRALMRHALAMAEARGLTAPQVQVLRAVLEEPED